jgi:hypothetical protein
MRFRTRLSTQSCAHFRVRLRMVRSRHDADRASGREITQK